MNSMKTEEAFLTDGEVQRCFAGCGRDRAKGDEAMGGRESAPEGCKSLCENNLKAQSHRSVTGMWMNIKAHILNKITVFSLSKPGSYRGTEQ